MPLYKYENYELCNECQPIDSFVGYRSSYPYASFMFYQFYFMLAGLQYYWWLCCLYIYMYVYIEAGEFLALKSSITSSTAMSSCGYNSQGFALVGWID